MHDIGIEPDDGHKGLPHGCGLLCDLKPESHNVNVIVYFDGISFSGTYPSSVAIPNSIAPAITALSSSSEYIGAPVTINGLYFGATQGTSTVKFNGISAPVTNWSNTSIQVVVPVSTVGTGRGEREWSIQQFNELRCD